MNKDNNSEVSIQKYLDVRFGSLEKEIENLEEAIKKLTDDMRSGFVRKEEFHPVRNVVYGLVSIILTTIIVGLIALVVR